MRPQQQNRRMRGRNGGGNNNNNNNNRKGPNPLNRNYESNGPDVKIRGSAQQIAEKYAALARDAQSSGDRVMAENYLQHAEHYNRIIAAAQAQIPIQHQQPRSEDFDDDLDEEREDFENGAAVGEAQVPAVNHGAGPQPVIEGMPAEVALNGDGNRDNGGNRNQRERRHNNGHGQNRGNDRRGGEAQAREEGAGSSAASAPSSDASDDAQPRIEGFNPAAIAAQAEQNEASSADAAPRRGRRPRRPRNGGQEAGTEGAEASEAPAAEAPVEG